MNAIPISKPEKAIIKDNGNRPITKNITLELIIL